MEGTREIQLTKGYVALVSEADFETLSAHKWHASWCKGGRVYAVSGAYIRMHRHILAAPRGVLVDHINGDPLDNRRENLRLCTHAENLRNRPATRRAKYGFKGVRLAAGAYRSEIMVAGRHTHLGRFRTPEEAARAYDAAALRLHGEFAWLNFPEAA